MINPASNMLLGQIRLGNPAEQVWQQLRDRTLDNRCYDSYDQVVDACCQA